MDFPFLPEVMSGDTTDVYFQRTRQVLDHQVNGDPWVGIQIFSGGDGVFCGSRQVEQILLDQPDGFLGSIYSLREGENIAKGEVGMQIFCNYSKFGVYETAILGCLASSTGWATAAREIVHAADMKPVVCFGARHIHPNSAAFMDYAAILGGCQTSSTPLGARLAGTEPSGTMPHALILIMGDTLSAAEAFDRVIDPSVPRVVLVDTFQDEVVEALRVANAMGKRLNGIRMDTPKQRGGVTPSLVIEARVRLDMAGHNHVKIAISGGLTPDRIRQFISERAPVDMFGVGSHIAHAPGIDFTADIRSIAGDPIAKRGRIPGMLDAERLTRIL